MIKLPPLKPDSDQMLHLDALRIVGALMIVVFHFNRFINLDGRWQLADDTIKTFSLIVDLFFVISGYVMAAIYTGRLTTLAKYGDFLKKRVARLGPLHWATMLVFIAVAAAGAAGWIQDRDAKRYDVACIVPNILFIHAWGVCKSQTWNFVSWAISAEMGVYIALPLLFWITARGRWVTGGLAILSLVILLQTPHGDRPFHQWTWDYGVLRAVPGFLIGMLGFQIRPLLAKLPYPNLVMWGLLAAFLIASPLKVPRDVLLLVIYAVGLAGIAADAAGPVGPVTRRLAPWAQLSFTLYMLHPIALKMGLAWVGLGMWNLNGDLMRLWVLFWVVALVPLAYLSLILFERPARDWITRLSWRKSDRSSPEAH
ncbi:acyltransferase family protein [Caulobacter henricii]|uniref:Acyltransferase n=1 Tax=Caulobacter henricii TaxID=69395 RepID=A0A0P0P453_9CAUL|nr:acyltransferase [Caulobacter henricii]ALL15350.1 acyltransferase [Caulobacter henricii]